MSVDMGILSVRSKGPYTIMRYVVDNHVCIVIFKKCGLFNDLVQVIA